MDLQFYPFLGIYQPVASLSHLLGALVFAVLGIVLIVRAHGSNRFWLAVFVVSALFLLSMSGVYHLLEPGTFAREEVLRRLDHAAIFVLIAGTLTAAHGILFSGWWRWGMIVPLWLGTAAAVTLQSVFFHEFSQLLLLALYLGFGWLGVIAGIKLARVFGFTLVRPALWGGISYTVGAIADAAAPPVWIPGYFGAHGFFHLTVLAGLGFHFYFLSRVAHWRPEHRHARRPRPR